MADSGMDMSDREIAAQGALALDVMAMTMSADAVVSATI